MLFRTLQNVNLFNPSLHNLIALNPESSKLINLNVLQITMFHYIGHGSGHLNILCSPVKVQQTVKWTQKLFLKYIHI
jgi:hypothetical protein